MYVGIIVLLIYARISHLANGVIAVMQWVFCCICCFMRSNKIDITICIGMYVYIIMCIGHSTNLLRTNTPNKMFNVCIQGSYSLAVCVYVCVLLWACVCVATYVCVCVFV